MSNTVDVRINNGENMTGWSIKTDGKYIDGVSKQLMHDGIPNEGISKIIGNAAEALSYCPNPQNPKKCNGTGLVIGKVQSGKTSNFISIAALAFDNGYNVVVVFGGTKNPLLAQNKERIKDYFRLTGDVFVLDTTNNRDILTEKKVTQFIKNGHKIVIVALKHYSHIDFIRENVFSGSLSEKPTLIIDDEGDEASLNTLVSKGKKSTTYKALENLKDSLDCHCFLSITATPQANILIDTIDVLSPDFGILVDPGEGYCGLDVFHSDDTYLKRINESESSLLDEGIPQSFIDAISMFFVACAIQKYRDNGKIKQYSMLIHPSQKKADHRCVYKKVEQLVDDWISYSENMNDLSYKPLRNILYKAYKEYTDTTCVDAPNFNDIESDIVSAINSCGLHTINGDSVGNDEDEFYDYNIYVGGAMLGRGLTLKGLIITYIIRTSKGTSNTDTVQQRARWFGYKNKYLDLCRIFAVDKIIREFFYIRDHEEDLWATVRETNLSGTRFKDMVRVFTLNESMRMTATAKAATKNYAFKLWNKQREFIFTEEYANSNKAILENVRNNLKNELVIKQFGAGAPYVMAEEIDFEYVKKEIFDKFIYLSEEPFNKSVVDKLSVLLKNKNIFPKVDVIWMRDGDTSKHSVVAGSIGNYSVGRRPKNGKATYLGDDYQFVKDDVMQLQIHMIEDNDSHKVSPTLALYIPRDIVSRLTNLVIKA